MAQYNLGRCYELGFGVGKNLAEALRCYKLAADQGSALARCALGECYEFGNGVDRDLEAAARYYKLAADQGQGLGQTAMGWCYELGLGVQQDWEAAARCYHQAAAEGHARALYLLGCCYREGNGVLLNFRLAALSYKQAADRGYAQAQLCMGHCYEIGALGVPQNLADAAKYYKLAADQGGPEAKSRLDRVNALIQAQNTPNPAPQAPSGIAGKAVPKSSPTLPVPKMGTPSAKAAPVPTQPQKFLSGTALGARCESEGKLKQAAMYYQVDAIHGDASAKLGLDRVNALIEAQNTPSPAPQMPLGIPGKAVPKGPLTSSIQEIGAPSAKAATAPLAPLKVIRPPVAMTNDRAASLGFQYEGKKDLSAAAHYYGIAAGQGDSWAKYALSRVNVLRKEQNTPNPAPQAPSDIPGKAVPKSSPSAKAAAVPPLPPKFVARQPEMTPSVSLPVAQQNPSEAAMQQLRSEMERRLKEQADGYEKKLQAMGDDQEALNRKVELLWNKTQAPGAALGAPSIPQGNLERMEIDRALNPEVDHFSEDDLFPLPKLHIHPEQSEVSFEIADGSQAMDLNVYPQDDVDLESFSLGVEDDPRDGDYLEDAGLGKRVNRTHGQRSKKVKHSG